MSLVNGRLAATNNAIAKSKSKEGILVNYGATNVPAMRFYCQNALVGDIARLGF
jgi:hypothetical protein